jgi:hypothetical protein
MDREIEEFRDEVVQWRGSWRQGAHPYPVLSGNSSRKLWLKFADFRGSYRTGGARSTPWMKQGCRSDGPAVMVIWARLLRFVVWPPCLGQRTALRHL